MGAKVRLSEQKSKLICVFSNVSTLNEVKETNLLRNLCIFATLFNIAIPKR